MDGPPSVPCAGAVVFDASGRLLMVLRAHDPGRGRWSLPGGKCEPGESAAVACVREVAEETGLAVAVVRALGAVEIPAGDGRTFAVTDFLCRLDSRPDGRLDGEVLAARSDAARARWVTGAEFAELDLVTGLADALAGWGLLPA